MTNLTLSNWLAIIGPSLVLIGIIIQIYDYFMSEKYRKMIDDFRLFIEKIDYISSDLQIIPKTRGMISPSGLDIGETAEIMESAAKIANKENRRKLYEKIDEIDSIRKKFRKFSILSWFLIVVGTGMQAASPII